MKASSIALTLAFFAPSVLFAEENFIRQIQTVNGQTLVYDIPAASDQGTVTSRPLASDSSIFQLYTYDTVSANNGNGNDNTTTTLKKLDEKTVGTYIPTASLVFDSEDPHFPARTRADRPYGLTVTVAGLSTDPEAPAYSKSVESSRSYKIYDHDTWTAYENGSQQGEYTESYGFVQNGSFTDEAISQRLPSETPTQVAGEETFTIRLDPTAVPNYSELASATIQIWPVATAGVVGLEEGENYRKIPTATSMVLENLYPESITYAQVYPGGRSLGTVGIVVPSSVISYGEDTQVPQRAILSLSDEDISEALGEDGTYTLEVLTVTPFNGRAPELLTDVTFDVDRTISVRAQVTTTE